MSESAEILSEAASRRTFAIISHPDAGKTTLTEKFLLYAGAIQTGGAVKARGDRRAATSDWMEMERQRGISISSTVLQFPYRDCIFNLLDTPGHRDFSEDTYRVLSAVDAVIMVLDVAKGIEPQTLKLFEVCRSQNLPVITFFNKYDRPGRDPLELLDEVEQQIGLRPTPATWPVGQSGDFRGVIDRRTGDFVRFTRVARGASIAPEEIVSPEIAAQEEGAAWQTALDGIGLLDAIGADVDLESFAAFIFKIQANMDPNHRDRIAFARICSGKFERGMDVDCARTEKAVGTKYATTAFGSERETIEEAYPGDVIGLVNTSGLQIGDTLHAGKSIQFPALPRFAPEVFATARPLDSSKFKQFRRGLQQLDEEGVVQVLRDPDMGDADPILAAVGQLQFEVLAHRLAHEFNAPTEILTADYQAIRITDKETAPRLREIGGIRILRRSDDALVALFQSRYRLQRLEADEPSLTLTPIIAGSRD
jgi:peptide chain release factor 3